MRLEVKLLTQAAAGGSPFDFAAVLKGLLLTPQLQILRKLPGNIERVTKFGVGTNNLKFSTVFYNKIKLGGVLLASILANAMFVFVGALSISVKPSHLPRDPGSPNVSGWLEWNNHLRNAKYLGSITILRRWLDP